eukprot:TRINITY_DN11962_c0_g3_i1.p1 TRINITY_DN11962_c0_g3~~TRINITY_DN11962_c0_g3_i1.p1  ORF type:complete len:473 (+),score=112.06 TRINITY_DN11962_c0_g3_i1:135-1553(+)
MEPTGPDQYPDPYGAGGDASFPYGGPGPGVHDPSAVGTLDPGWPVQQPQYVQQRPQTEVAALMDKCRQLPPGEQPGEHEMRLMRQLLDEPQRALDPQAQVPPPPPQNVTQQLLLQHIQQQQQLGQGWEASSLSATAAAWGAAAAAAGPGPGGGTALAPPQRGAPLMHSDPSPAPWYPQHLQQQQPPGFGAMPGPHVGTLGGKGVPPPPPGYQPAPSTFLSSRGTASDAQWPQPPQGPQRTGQDPQRSFRTPGRQDPDPPRWQQQRPAAGPGGGAAPPQAGHAGARGMPHTATQLESQRRAAAASVQRPVVRFNYCPPEGPPITAASEVEIVLADMLAVPVPDPALLLRKRITPEAARACSEGEDGRRMERALSMLLLECAKHGWPECCRYLLGELRVPPGGRNREGKLYADCTPLHAAARFGRPEVCKVLVAGGARVLDADMDGVGVIPQAEKALDTVERLVRVLSQGVRPP